MYVGLASDTADASSVAFLSSWSINFGTDDVEVTSFGDANKVYVSGLPDIGGSYSGFYDTATAQLYTAASDGKARKFYLYPTSETTGQYFFGTGIFDFNVETGVNDASSISGDFKAASLISKVG